MPLPAQGLTQIFAETKIDIVDVLEFVNKQVLSKLNIKTRLSSLALHPTCSGVELNINQNMKDIAEMISIRVVIPDDWACCGFAGDRGLLHPALTASATKKESEELNNEIFAAYASSNRPCQQALSQATGQNYVHLIELVDRVS
jgi:D-lactate dehydrogenase